MKSSVSKHIETVEYLNAKYFLDAHRIINPFRLCTRHTGKRSVLQQVYDCLADINVFNAQIKYELKTALATSVTKATLD